MTMKDSKILNIGVIIVLVSFISIACNKANNERIAAFETDLDNKSVVQVAVATVNATRNYLYVDSKQITGATLSSGSIFPVSATGVGFNVEGGFRSFLVRDTLSTTTQMPFSFAESFNVSTHYTLFLYDTITAPKQKTVKDNIVIPPDTTCRLRFANFIYNNAAVPNVDVFSFNRNANIFTNIAVTDVTEFIPYPSRLPADTLYIREAGTMNLLLKQSIGVLTPKRNYTFLYRGSFKGTKTFTFYATY